MLFFLFVYPEGIVRMSMLSCFPSICAFGNAALMYAITSFPNDNARS